MFEMQVIQFVVANVCPQLQDPLRQQVTRLRITIIAVPRPTVNAVSCYTFLVKMTSAVLRRSACPTHLSSSRRPCSGSAPTFLLMLSALILRCVRRQRRCRLCCFR